MKGTEYIIVFLFVSFISKAQLPFPTKNTTWRFMYLCENYTEYKFGTYQYTGNYILHRNDTCFQLNTSDYIKVKGNKVFALEISDQDTTILPLYDFSLQVGDSMQYDEDYDLKFSVDKIDTLIINNRIHKRWYVSHMIWIEGIGSINDLIETPP